jgi:hypothetical protein
MVLGNFTPFRAKHVTAIKFGSTALTDTAMAATDTSLDAAYTAANATNLINLTGDADAVNPTISYAFAKDFTTSGNERSSSEEALLGADTIGSQNTELTYGNNSKIDVEFTCVYRNPMVTSIFNDSTKICLIQLDNEESSVTGALNMLFNNIVMTHVGSLTRNSDGLMEQKVKFTIRGGFAGTVITCTDAPLTYVRYRVGPDYAEEIQTADSS